MNDVVIVGACRTAVGRRGGSFAATHPNELLGHVQMEVLLRSGVRPSDVGQVIAGCPTQSGAQAGNIGRLAWLAHGGPVEVGGMTVTTACGSSQTAITLGHALLRSGLERVVLSCGVENMSMVPLGSSVTDALQAGHGEPSTPRFKERFEFTSQFEGAERIAQKYGITREDADAYGLLSQQRARQAIDSKAFEPQIAALPELDVDESLRDTSLAALAVLKPVAGPEGVHTAGTSSQIADGAAAVLMMTESRAAELGVQPLARVMQSCLIGCDPVLMLEGPIPATQQLLAQSGMAIGDVDVFEVNEAFASVVLAWQRAHRPDMDKVNPSGGAIALGHPLGATGCILVTKAVHELHRTDKEIALVTMCCGGGLGTGTLLQRI